MQYEKSQFLLNQENKMEIQDGQGYPLSVFGNGGTRWPIAFRMVGYFALCGYQFMYVIQYMFQKGDVHKLWWSGLLGFGTFLLLLAAVEGVYITMKRATKKIKPGESYYLFLIFSSMTIACLWDNAFNKAALFAVFSLGCAVWIFITDPLFRPDSEEEPELILPPKSYSFNKRKARRKRNKSKRR